MKSFPTTHDDDSSTAGELTGLLHTATGSVGSFRGGQNVLLFTEVLEEIGDKLGPPEQIRDQEPRNPK